MSAFEEYLSIQHYILEDEYIAEILAKVLDDEDVEPNFARIYEVTTAYNLPNVYQRIVKRLQNEAKLDKKVDINKFFGVLYLLLLENTENSWDHVNPLDGLYILLLYGNFNHSHSVFQKLNFSSNVYFMAMRNLAEHKENNLKVPKDLLLLLNTFLQHEEVPFDYMYPTIEFLFICIGRQFDMIHSLQIYDLECTEGFLAFVCLFTIMTKYFDVTQVEKAKMIEFVFNRFERYSKPNSDLSEFQQRTLKSNFCAFVRQIGPHLQSDLRSLIYASVSLSKLHYNSTTMVLLLTQLPYEMYEQVASLLTKTAKLRYDWHRQNFCYLLLENPYIFDNTEPGDSYFKLIDNLIIAVIWPIKKSEVEITTKTAKLIMKILQISDENIQKVMIEKLKSDKLYNALYLLSFIYECCNTDWKNKAVNQYFLCIFSSITVKTGKVHINSFEQFRRLTISADPTDLLPCLDSLTSLLLLDDADFYKVLCKIFVINANSKDKAAQPLEYLKALNKVLFTNLTVTSSGIKVALAMFSYGLDMDALLKKMINAKLLKPEIVAILVQLLFDEVNTWPLLEIIMPEFQSTPLPRNLNTYWEKCGNLDFFNKPTISCFLSTISKCLQFKTNCFSHELSLFTAIITFIHDCMMSKTLPIATVYASLVVYKKVYNLLNCDLQQLLLAYRDVEKTLKKGLKKMSKSNNIRDSHFLHRDLVYYEAINTTFLEKPQFAPDREVVSYMTDCLVTMSPASLCEYPEYGAALLRCCTQISRGHDSLHTALLYKLNVLIQVTEPKLQVAALNSFYDLVLSRRFALEDLEKAILSIFSSTDSIAVANAITLYMNLIQKEYIVPDHYQIYIILLLLTDETIRAYVGNGAIESFYACSIKLFEKYFEHIVLYFNKCYNLTNYSLTTEQIKSIPDKTVNAQKKHEIYFKILSAFTQTKAYRTVTFLYNDIVMDLKSLGLDYLTSYELVQDIICITFYVLTPGKDLVPISYKNSYSRILEDIKHLKKPTHDNYGLDPVNTFLISFQDCNIALKTTLVSLINFLANIDSRGTGIMPELMFILLCLTKWYDNNIKCIISEEGAKGKLKAEILSIPKLYNSNKSAFDHNPPRVVYDAIRNCYARR